MESLRKIVVNKYLTSFENVKKADLLTEKEYNTVHECGLNELLKVENNPQVLEQICEGEKLQTAEFYDRQEKKYHQNVAKVYRKDRLIPPRPRVAVVPPEAVSEQELPIPANNVPAGESDLIRNVPETTGSGGENQPQADPYQLCEEEAPIMPRLMPLALPVEDENFGSNEADGARDFLELCTGLQLPAMSMRQTMTRDMLVAQFPTIPSREPIVDNFQDIDLPTIDTPLFMRPPGTTSTPAVLPSSQLAPVPLPHLTMPPIGDHAVHDPPVVAEPIVTEERQLRSRIIQLQQQQHPQNGPVDQPVIAQDVQAVQAESSTSAETPEEIPRPRQRSRRMVRFTECLEPLDSTIHSPRPRRAFDIFSFPYHTCWNQMIQDVQNQFQLELQIAQLHEVPVMRGEPSVRQELPQLQSTDGTLKNPMANVEFETPNLTRDNPQLPVEHPTALNIVSGLDSGPVPQELTLSLPMGPPISMDPLPSLDGQLSEVHKTNRPIADMSSVLYNQAKDLETIYEEGPAEEEVVAIDTMLIDIIIVVQSEMATQRQKDEFISINRVQEQLRITSPMALSKMIKNIILLKQAGLLITKCSEDRQVQGVVLKLPPADILALA
ncbi:uncharacterized protein LOC128723946 [Anopheles nili]|uniref:uncharacterized protein LOC128723946 n=1 Tax=Anopheles nili TaxID=185578 RepID=UPI00237A8355|nr:uncharacterized protein LOC128723946 [Anopheles nili]